MKKQLSIYLIHPISGLTFKEVWDYYQKNVLIFKRFGYEVWHPLIGKEQIRPESILKAHGVANIPTASNHAIAERDMHSVQSVDVCYADFIGCKGISIGSVMELAIASYLRKHTVVAMEKDNPHAHCFVYEAADTCFKSSLEARDYLKQWIRG